MAQQTIGVGAAANDGTGDPLRDAYIKCNDNFTELYGGSLFSANNLSDVANPATARTNIGATTVGGNIFTLANPSAVTFLRVNADNSVTALSASAFRTAIGAGTGSGSGDLVSTNNLSDVASAATSRTNLFASEVLCFYVAADAFTIPANMAGTQVNVGTNPAATFAIDVQKNGSTIGTISISTGGVATLTTTGGTSKSIAAGDVIKFVAPGSADATIANVAINVKGTL
jgi:hypothetical protein